MRAPSLTVYAAPSAPVEHRSPGWLPWTVCAVAALVPIWSVKYLPMTDLPHHAAQVAIWAHYADPSLHFSRWFTINLRSPYLAAYALARVAAEFVSVPAALKLTISAVVLAFPLSFLRILAVTGGDRTWALLGFPLAFGLSFYWGLLNFFAASPLGILLVAEGLRYAGCPTRRSGVEVALLAILLYFAHVLVFLFACGIVALVVVARSPGIRAGILRLAPVALPAAAAGCWLLSNSREPVVREWGTFWGLGVLRPFELGVLLGPGPGGPFQTLGAALLAILVLARRPRRELWGYIPLAVAAAVFAFAPRLVSPAGLFNARFATFLVPTALVALRPSYPRRATPWLLTAVVVAFFAVLQLRFQRFDVEAREFDRILERLQPGRSVMALPLDPTSAHIAGTPYLHFAGWYQAANGGRLGGSFADLFTMVARHREPFRRSASRSLDDYPQLFTEGEDGTWDYYIVRSAEDPTDWLSARVRSPVCRDLISGKWHLYRRDDRATRGAKFPDCSG